MSFLAQAAILTKRDGGRLGDADVAAFVAGAADGSIPDYQVSAMLMAIYFRGLDDGELAAWADAMLHSGDVIDLSAIARPKVDKHSTGGVGDKISLPLAPAVAACGAAVPMISGRGLGHTGGTLDKLESIPGFRVDLDVARFVRQVDELGVCLIGQTERIAPADRRLYALRDVTATVESVPLIASSIMSKKLAEGIDSLVLDCKVGDGAFMRTREQAAELARAIQAIGAAAGVPVTVVLTAMDEPIGTMVGNAVEVAESIEVLRGGGPADTRELTCALGGEMLVAARIAADPADGRRRIEAVLADGSALELFGKVVSAQGGDRAVIDRPDQLLPRAPHRMPVLAERDGAVSRIAARDIGVAAMWLGAGRRYKDDDILPAVGIELAKKVGDRVTAGEPLAYLLHADRGVDEARQLVASAIQVADNASAPGPRVLEVLR